MEDSAPDSGEKLQSRRPTINYGLDLSNAEVVKAFCADLDVGEDELRLAVALVGTMPAALRFYIKSKGAVSSGRGKQK